MMDGIFWRIDWSNFRKIRLDTCSKIGMSTKSLRLSALNATDREAFGSELGGRQKTVMCRYWFLAELTTPIAGDGRA
jgi:hypothetical protein